MVKQKLWGGAFAKGPDELAWRFGQSIDSDSILGQEEIEVSIAHAEMLGACGILPASEAALLVQRLTEIGKELSAGASLPDDAEDIHAAIEQMLRAEVGEVADKLHAGRSRNDQIATVTRLWLKRACDALAARAVELQKVLLKLGEKHQADAMPGFTHMQPAQPITLGLHLMAYFWMLERDKSRLAAVKAMADECPLGSAALAGTSLPINREMTAAKLGFSCVTANALDATSDRDFVGDALHYSATLMQHLSRLSQELVLWSTPMYGFVRLDEAYATGSSIMPQKRNPDMAELIRGRSARVIGHWTAFMSMMRALPLGYNRDQQEDKPGLFDSVSLCLDSLQLCARMLSTAEFQTWHMSAIAGDGFSTATGVAEAMVMDGMPFRQAHEATGKLVRQCEETGTTLDALTGLSPEVHAATDVTGSIAARDGQGGPGPTAMTKQLDEAKKVLGK